MKYYIVFIFSIGFAIGVIVTLFTIDLKNVATKPIVDYNGHEYINFGTNYEHNPDCKYCLEKFD